MIASCVIAAVIAAVSLCLFFAELTGVVHLIHPLFWLPIWAGAMGIAGSNYLYVRTYLGRP